MKFSGGRFFEYSALLCLAVITLLQITVTIADGDGIRLCNKPNERYMKYGRPCSDCGDPQNCDAERNLSGCFCNDCFCRNIFGYCVVDQRCYEYN